MEGIYDLLLIGSDRRDSNWYGNSDAMVLVTVNSKTKTLYLTSFMRDLYADIPDVGVRKLNAAHARGGGPLLVSTLESNYGVSIDNYASVDFGSMTEIIDLIGGVDVEISPEEVDVANQYVGEICRLQNKDASDYQIPSSGLTHLNGIQAVAFQRIRYVGNADFERTSRQREVLQAMLTKARTLSVTEIASLADDILLLVTHNVDQATTLKLLAQVPTILSYDVVENRIPYDGSFYITKEILVPNDRTETINQLRNTIYAVE